jgi:hypothetical protein
LSRLPWGFSTGHWYTTLSRSHEHLGEGDDFRGIVYRYQWVFRFTTGEGYEVEQFLTQSAESVPTGLEI